MASGETEGTFPDHPPDPVILLLIGNRANRRLLQETLGDRYEIEAPEGSIEDLQASIDLCVLDVQAFYRHKDELHAAKQVARPAFLPLLLVRSERADLDGVIWDHVDDIVTPPIRKRELNGRIRTLLRARGLSMSLAQQNEHLEEFADILAHDLRNPLTGAMNFARIARETHEPEHFDRVESALDRMETIISNLLSFARYGQVVADAERIELGDVLRDAWDIAPTADAHLVVDMEASIEADVDRLQSAFENLFRNAIEHGGDDVTVSVGRLETGFYVADDGPGIPEEDRERVFEYGHSSVAGGTGFGLAIVEQIIEAHGWEIVASASAQGGAKFEVRGVELFD